MDRHTAKEVALIFGQFVVSLAISIGIWTALQYGVHADPKVQPPKKDKVSTSALTIKPVTPFNATALAETTATRESMPPGLPGLPSGVATSAIESTQAESTETSIPPVPGVPGTPGIPGIALDTTTLNNIPQPDVTKEYLDKQDELIRQLLSRSPDKATVGSMLNDAATPYLGALSDDQFTLRNQASLIALSYGIPPRLFHALINQESGWNHKAYSRVGAIGLTQVMPYNIKAMGYEVKDFSESPVMQLELGAKYLSDQYKTFGSWDLALAAYNAGPGAVRKYGGIPPYAETINYVKSILAMADDSAG